jgi:hypothetical protein
LSLPAGAWWPPRWGPPTGTRRRRPRENRSGGAHGDRAGAAGAGRARGHGDDERLREDAGGVAGNERVERDEEAGGAAEERVERE